MGVKQIINSKSLLNELLLGKETGELSEVGVDIIIDMINIASIKYVDRREYLNTHKLSKKEKKEMIEYAYEIFERKLWININPDKLNVKDRHNKALSYIMTIILSSFAGYTMKLARKKGRVKTISCFNSITGEWS